MPEGEGHAEHSELYVVCEVDERAEEGVLNEERLELACAVFVSAHHLQRGLAFPAHGEQKSKLLLKSTSAPFVEADNWLPEQGSERRCLRASAPP